MVAWISATLPTLEISFVFQVHSLSAILFTKAKKVSTISPPLNTGHLRCLPKLSWGMMLNTVDTDCLSCSVALLKNVSDDLRKLILVEFIQNQSKVLTKFKANSTENKTIICKK